jgi:hypothetical protein
MVAMAELLSQGTVAEAALEAEVTADWSSSASSSASAVRRPVLTSLAATVGTVALESGQEQPEAAHHPAHVAALSR